MLQTTEIPFIKHWADEMYLPSFKSHQSAEIVAICGRNREHGKEMAQKYRISQVFTDYRELIKNASVNAIVSNRKEIQNVCNSR